MKTSRLLSLAATLGGAAASLGLLDRRHAWEDSHRRMAICVDYDDAKDAAVRAGMPYSEMLARLAANGATHLSLPELTLARLLAQGRLAPQAPATPLNESAPLGHWTYLYGDVALVTFLVGALQARVPQTAARALDGTTLAFAGNLPTVAELGLGFEREEATRIKEQGLAVVPRPVAYDCRRHDPGSRDASGRDGGRPGGE